MSINADAFLFHGYVAAISLIVALTAGLVWALIPVGLGFALLLIAMS